MIRLHTLLHQIKLVQMEILRVMPYRDISIVPNPGASEQDISVAERRIGRPLPPSYRAFLRTADGWPRFFEGASLLGTDSLGQKAYETLAHAACEAAETPVPEVGPPSRYRQTVRSLIPFGIDGQATTLFAFNPCVETGGGEYQVIAWVNEIGVRRDTFEDFLEFVLELCGGELPVYGQLERQIA